MSIVTDRFSEQMRRRVLRPETEEVLIARLPGSREAEDRYTRVNCGGYGRIRTYQNYTLHLRASVAAPTPMLRGHPPVEVLRTQVFQLAACNWRCWYCFVDDDRLSANTNFARYFNPSDLVDMYLDEPDPPDVLDLSGGQPDLVPEWCLWTMEALERRGLRGKTYTWIDDNLSTSYVWDYLTPEQVDYMATCPRHSRVGCFKGFDPESFAHTTGAEPEIFERQFEIFRRLVDSGFDMYAYATFTGQPDPDLPAKVADFVDRLQAVHRYLPLRTVPLRIHPFSATLGRLTAERSESLETQHKVFDLWQTELEQRFSPQMRSGGPDEITLD